MSTPPPPPPKRTTDTSVSPRTFFSPKKKINRMIGKTTITTYPDITPEMPNEERSHAFSINRAALVNARAIPYATKTSFLGEFMGESTIVDVEKAEYLRFAHDWCQQKDNLTVIQYFDHRGQPVANWKQPAPSNDIKALQDGPVTACRPANITFVQVETTVDLTEPCQLTTPPAVRPTFPFRFFIRLPTAEVTY